MPTVDQTTVMPAERTALGEPSVPGELARPLSRGVRRAAVGALTRTGLANLCRPLTHGNAVIFMLHRLADPDRGVPGFEPDLLRTLLAFLRRKRYQVIDLHQALERLRGDGPPLRRAVVFTMDDGYVEQANIAGPVFAEFDCPVTTFLATGFLDGATWFWWDQIDYVFAKTRRRDVAVEIHGARHRYLLEDAHQAQSAQVRFTARCKEIPDTARETAVRSLAAAAEVDLPSRAPARYAPMSWDQVRSAERRGMTFGPHTVTHPVLSRTDDLQSRFEIDHSWTRLKTEARSPVPVFAYPNGRSSDFGAREIETLREIGLESACTCIPAYATPRRFRLPNGSFNIPRFAPPDSIPYLIQFVSGLERLKLLLRGLD